ncbi:hypothetical protein HYX58_05495 [Candidatus Dependentiae bacterium]|nr:hypothetical protein [Candidatus Dependentiae bacterium]
MIWRKKTPSFIGVCLFDDHLELSCTKEEDADYNVRTELILLTGSQIVNGLIYNRGAISEHIARFAHFFHYPFIVLSVNDRLIYSDSLQQKNLAAQHNFHFFLFIIENNLNCSLITTHDRAKDLAQSRNFIHCDHATVRAVGLYLLGKEYYEKNS